MRKQKTEAQKALEQYAYAEDVKNETILAIKIGDLIRTIEVTLSVDTGNATVALRDYAQYLLAVRSDARLEALKAETDVLLKR